MKRITYLIVIAVIVSFALTGSPLCAEEVQTANDTVLSQVEQLKNLRESNPDAYRQWVEQRKAEVRQTFQQMNGERQSQFKQFVEGRQTSRFERLRNFREQRPQAFQRFMNQRMQRWQTRAQNNPERYQNFLNNHPRFKERLENFKAQNNLPNRQILNQDAPAAGQRADLTRPQKIAGGRNPAEFRRQEPGIKKAPIVSRPRGGRTGGGFRGRGSRGRRGR